MLGLSQNALGKAFGEKIPESRLLTLKTSNVAIGIKTLGSFPCWEDIFSRMKRRMGCLLLTVPKSTWDCRKTPQARPSEKKYRSVGC